MKKRIILSLVALLIVLTVLAGIGKLSVSHASEVFYNQVMNVYIDSDDGTGNLRTGPGLEYAVITPVYNGTSLYITAITVNNTDGLTWGRTTYNGRSGWISMTTTHVSNIEQASKAVYDVKVTQAENIYLRFGPGTEYVAYSYRPSKGQILRIDQTVVNDFDGRPWGHTSVNGLQGWVSLNWTYREDSQVYNQARDVYYSNNKYYALVQSGNSSISFRSGPAKSYSLITWLNDGITLYVTETLDNSKDNVVWGKTTYNGNSGWIPLNYTKIVTVENASTYQYRVTVDNSTNIRLRNGPGTEYAELVSYIPKGTELNITQTMINSFDGRPWGKTNYKGYEGWVSLDWTVRN